MYVALTTNCYFYHFYHKYCYYTTINDEKNANCVDIKHLKLKITGCLNSHICSCPTPSEIHSVIHNVLCKLAFMSSVGYHTLLIVACKGAMYLKSVFLDFCRPKTNIVISMVISS